MNYDRDFPLHGPGPPVLATAETIPMNREMEIQRLKSELQLCQGKIKGYETLGQLFQESKLECARYKQKNEELAKRLDSLTRHQSPSEMMYKPADVTCLNVQSSSDVPLNDDRKHTGSSESSLERDAQGFNVTSSRHHPVALPIDSEQQTCLNLKEVGATTPPTNARGKSPAPSSASSPSFVQINSSDAGSPVSPLSSAGNTDASKQPRQSYVMSSASMARITGTDLSSEVNQLAEHLKTIGHSSGASTQDLAGDLIRAGVNVIKLQKQTRMQQVLIEQMTAQNEELRADISAKQRTIQILQKDCDTLRNTVRRMEIARDQAMQDARVKYSEASKEQDDPLGGPSSCEWVEVESHQSSAASSQAEGAANERETVVTAVPMVEVELRRRIEKLNATISELVSVNRSWDEHCRQLESSHVQQMATLQSKLDAAEHRTEEYEQADQKRQLEFDNILLNAKKQREAEEMAKEEALNELHLERQQRIEYEQKCIEFSRKAAELENRVLQQRFIQAELVQNSRRVDESNQLLTSTREQELQTHLLILQEQVRVFKEDFDQERRDREQARTKMEALQKKLKEQSDENYTIRQKLTQATTELNALKTERDRWRQRYQKLADDLQLLQRQARPAESRTVVPLPRDVTHTPIQPPPAFQNYYATPSRFPEDVTYAPTQPTAIHNYYLKLPSWVCAACTFKNDGQRTTCEMCGRKKLRDLNHVYSANEVDGRSVAGLRSSQSAPPITSLALRRLETDRHDEHQ